MIKLEEGTIEGVSLVYLEHYKWSAVIDLSTEAARRLFDFFCINLFDFDSGGDVSEITECITNILDDLISLGNMKVTCRPRRLFGLNYLWRWVYFKIIPDCCDMKIFQYPGRLFETGMR